MLKKKLRTLEGLDPAIAALYTKKGEEFHLDAEADEEPAKVKEMRETAIRLRKLLTRLGAKEGSEEDAVAEIEALQAKMDAHEDGDLLRKGDIEGVVKRRTERAVAQAEARVKAAEEKAAKDAERAGKVTGKLHSMIVRSAALEALGRVGSLNPGAADDALSRAMQAWRVDPETDAPYAVTVKDGKEERAFGEKGQPLALEEWAAGLVKTAPHLFAGSGGGGSGRRDTGVPQRTASGARIVDPNDSVAMGHVTPEQLRKGEVVIRS